MVPMRMVCPKRCRASMSVPLILCPASTRLSVVTPVMVAWKASPETLVRTSSARSILAISRSGRSTAGPEAAVVLVSRSYAVSLMLGALEDATGQRCKDIRCRLYRFDHAGRGTLRQRRAHGRQLHKNKIAQGALGKIGDADRRDVGLDGHPFMLSGISDFHRFTSFNGDN